MHNLPRQKVGFAGNFLVFSRICVHFEHGINYIFIFGNLPRGLKLCDRNFFLILQLKKLNACQTVNNSYTYSASSRFSLISACISRICSTIFCKFSTWAVASIFGINLENSCIFILANSETNESFKISSH